MKIIKSFKGFVKKGEERVSERDKRLWTIVNLKFNSNRCTKL